MSLKSDEFYIIERRRKKHATALWWPVGGQWFTTRACAEYEIKMWRINHQSQIFEYRVVIYKRKPVERGKRGEE